mmetsp:Transcript_16067/g.44786  ORF Transcript_16067/g.44786 Transcript_16067/m.44786 type:complete len:225 (-) Transcript_16067:1656-2330(-)
MRNAFSNNSSCYTPQSCHSLDGGRLRSRGTLFPCWAAAVSRDVGQEEQVARSGREARSMGSPAWEHGLGMTKLFAGPPSLCMPNRVALVSIGTPDCSLFSGSTHPRWHTARSADHERGGRGSCRLLHVPCGVEGARYAWDVAWQAPGALITKRCPRGRRPSQRAPQQTSWQTRSTAVGPQKCPSRWGFPAHQRPLHPAFRRIAPSLLQGTEPSCCVKPPHNGTS